MLLLLLMLLGGHAATAPVPHLPASCAPEDRRSATVPVTAFNKSSVRETRDPGLAQARPRAAGTNGWESRHGVYVLALEVAVAIAAVHVSVSRSRCARPDEDGNGTMETGRSVLD
jgi:hypothetical protein